MKYWIKERFNPQTGTYYVACGQLPKNVAKIKEKALYGHNVMHEFENESDYNMRLQELRKEGRLIL